MYEAQAHSAGGLSMELDVQPSPGETLDHGATPLGLAGFAAGAFDPSRRPQLDLAPIAGVATMQAAVSPDCSFRLVKSAIDAAQHEICLYIYNASADHLLALLTDAKNRGVHIRLMYDVNDTSGGETQKLHALGVELKEAPSTGDRRVFTVCHQKFAVIDDAILLIGSANWATTSIPLVTTPGQFKKGNREWLMRFDNAPLAASFKSLFLADWQIPAHPGPLGVAPPARIVPVAGHVPAALFTPPTQIFDIARVDLATPATITPIISPDDYFTLARDLIMAANTSVDIEQQYILAGDTHIDGLLAALAARKDELTIRIIVSPAFREAGKLDNWERSVASLTQFGLLDRLRAMNLDFYTHLHNKGLIIDRQTAVVTSTNWSENSIDRAREAGVIVPVPQVAEYFAQVFDFDWSIGLDPANVPEDTVQLLPAGIAAPVGFEEVHPADMA
jgi:phosphatidylserine/phosphatidylglycerophosphate/cardiolipin synthase-like enzyme